MGATVKIAFVAEAQGAKREFDQVGDSAKKSGQEIETSFAGAGDRAAREFSGMGDKAKREFGDVGDAASKAGKDVVQEFDQAADKAGKSFEGVGDEAGKGFDGIADKLKGSLGGLAGAAGGAALAAGAAIGAVLVSGISNAMEQGQVVSSLQATLGIGRDEAAKYGKLAGEIYADNFGTDLQQVGTAVRRVFQDIGEGSEEWSRETVQDVLTVSTAFDQDLGGVTRAVGQLLRTGLAKDAKEALDVLTAGFQAGVDKADDLLDTFNEYGTQFRKFGLSAETAMGLLSQGLQAGARDADTVADALKEFAIRAVDGSKTTKDGFESLGLSAQKLTEDLAAGGPRASAALDLVLDSLRNIKDPAEQSRIAVELFGTKAEDLGGALLALDPSSAVQALGQVEGAAKTAGEALAGDATAKIEAFKRTLQGWATDELNNAVNSLDAIAKKVPPSVWDGISSSVSSLKGAVGGLGTAWGDLFSAVTGGMSGQEALLQTLRGLRGAIDVLVIAVDGLIVGYKLTESAVQALIAGYKLLSGDLDGAKAAWARSKQAAEEATDAAKKQATDVDNLKKHWQEGGAAIEKANQDVAAAAVIAGKQTGDAHDRGAQTSIAAYRNLATEGTTSGATVSKAHQNSAKDSVSAWSGAKAQISGFFSNVGGLLTSAGRSIMSGLESGLRTGWENVKSFLSSITGQIPNLKGPREVDRRLLFESGQLVMGGFARGLEAEYSDIRASLRDFTSSLASNTAIAASGNLIESPIPLQSYLPAAQVVDSTQKIALELRSSGSRVDDLLLEWLRAAIRVRGGDVQLVLGR